jgi:hypothetical protein
MVPSNRCILAITLGIYLRSGTTIYRKHRQLRKFQGSGSGGMSSLSRGDGAANMKTTEITVVSEAIGKSEALEMQGMGGQTTLHATNPVQTRHNTSIPISMEAKHQQATHATTVTGGATRPPRRIYQEVNNAAWQYTKCALLFFIVILITWIPSSANRVYSHLHPHESSVTLQYMSAIVLPLQGFWNAVIYAFTSAAACKKLANDAREMWQRRSRGDNDQLQRIPEEPPSWMRTGEGKSFRERARRPGARPSSDSEGETESMRKLANSTLG